MTPPKALAEVNRLIAAPKLLGDKEFLNDVQIFLRDMLGVKQ